MRLSGNLRLALLLTLTCGVTCLNIPMEVEQLPTITSHTPSPVIALPFEQSVTLRCEARGNPPPQYRWTRDGSEFVPPDFAATQPERRDGTFVLRNKHFTQLPGKYRCYATNKLGTAMTEEIQLIVPNVPKFPKEVMEPIVVDEGQPIALRCDPPTGVPPRQIFWMSHGLHHIEQDDRVSMGTDGSLYFSNVLPKDTREDYCCFAAFSKLRTIVQKSAMVVLVKALNPANESDASSNATFAPPERKPSLLLPSGVQTEVLLLKGQELQLECMPEGFPTPKVEWMKLGAKLPTRTKYKNFGKLLSVSGVEESDEGKYMCKAKNPAGVAVHYFDVIVEEPPKWLTEPPQGQLTVVRSDIQIKCSVTGKPQPEITWRRNGEVFKDEPLSHRRVLDDTVVLQDAGPEDTSVYQCEASNSHGTLLANANIMVINMPPLMLTQDYQEYAVVQGGDVVMDCRVFGSPPPTISWAKDETPETIEGERFFVLPNGSLQVIGAEKEDSGEYVCVATNTEGKAAITAALAVKGPTKIIDPLKDMEVISGSTVQLVCGANYDKSLRSSFKVLWRKDGEEILLSSEENPRFFADDGMLQIMSVNRSDQGEYTCIARTRLDADNATALLTVLDVPEAPKNVSMSVISPRNVTLSWVAGNDHNSSVTEFVVEYEESQWEPGRWKELEKVPGNQATAELALHGHLDYQFRVYAINAVGRGPPSEPTERYKTPPTAPDRNPENIRIQGPLPHQMDISWEPLRPVEHNGPGLEYKVSYRRRGLDKVWTEQLVRRHSLVVRNTSTFVPYEVKIQSRNSHSWGPEPNISIGYSGEDVPTAAPRDVAVEVINTTVLRVSWSQVPDDTLRGHLGGYNVHWQRNRSLLNPKKVSEERQSLAFPGERSHAIVAGLKPFSEYRVTVNVFNKKGSGPNSKAVTFNTPEGVPVQVPILTTSNAQRSSILLVWGPPLQANGVLAGYLLHYQLINETSLEVVDSREMNVSGADTTQWQLGGLEEGSLYRFLLSACTRAGCGPPLAQESRTPAQARVSTLQSNISTQGWLIGTMCAVALLTLIVLIVCFVRRNKGGKYAVKEKEDLHPDVEREMNDDTLCEYSDSEEIPLRGCSASLSGDVTIGDSVSRDSVSRDSMGDYADGAGEFSEDGSFIGEYSGYKHRSSVSEHNGPVSVSV
ncbi:cell adhesion molecule L1-like a isoform X2 [Genypterus blacodes]|uniref:cell adhesion molecule L1-like a isoform X2 n=1 Tax=Genypterus blacodes TaxID=154954 RepID=UPI003F764191